jgi:hypothetical protein
MEIHVLQNLISTTPVARAIPLTVWPEAVRTWAPGTFGADGALLAGAFESHLAFQVDNHPAIRTRVLKDCVRRENLREEVRRMRQRMRTVLVPWVQFAEPEWARFASLFHIHTAKWPTVCVLGDRDLPHRRKAGGTVQVAEWTGAKGKLTGQSVKVDKPVCVKFLARP